MANTTMPEQHSLHRAHLHRLAALALALGLAPSVAGAADPAFAAKPAPAATDPAEARCLMKDIARLLRLSRRRESP